MNRTRYGAIAGGRSQVSCVLVAIAWERLLRLGALAPRKAEKRPTEESERVADIIQADGMGQLSKEHAHHVTP
jgi:hypothetical protein